MRAAVRGYGTELQPGADKRDPDRRELERAGHRLLQAALWAITKDRLKAAMGPRLRTVAMREVMTANPVTVPASATVTRFLHDLLPWLRHSVFPVLDDDGQTVGLVTVRRVNAVPADERDRTTLREVACPLDEVARATPDEPVADLLPRLNGCSDGRALVFDGGRLAGIVAPADISRALERISGNRGPFGSAGRGRRP